MTPARLEPRSDAPAGARAEALIEAPIQTVWAVLSDLQNWPSWNKSVTAMRLDGPVQAGTSFAWRGGGWKIASRLEEVIPPRRIAWSGRMLGIRACHAWQLDAEGQATRVQSAESFEGFAARLFPGLARRSLVKALDQGLAALKAAAESRPGRPAAQPPAI